MDDSSLPCKSDPEKDEGEIKKQNQETPLDEESLKHRTRKVSILEGVFGVSSGTLSDNYIIPFALAIGASPFQVGILYSFGGLFSPIGQILGSRQIKNNSRRKVLLQGIIGQASMWPLFLLIAILFMHDLLVNVLSWILILLYLVYMISGGVMTPPWFSVMGDVIPEDSRGRYFARRNLITTGIALFSTFLLSIALDWYKNQQQVIIGFILIFLVGLITRLFSFFLFTKHYYPPFEIRTEDHIGFKQFVYKLPKDNFGKFTIFVAFVTFGLWIASPFFSIYMLDELHFSYIVFVIVNLSSSVIALGVFPFLGKFGDKYGNVHLLRLGAILIPFLPIMWLFFSSPLALILGPQVVGGIGWTAFNLAASNFIYDNIPRKNRGECLALYNFLLGIGIVLGGLTGSLIVSFVSLPFINNYLFVFLISGIVRLIGVILFLPRIKEVRITLTKPIFNIKNSSFYKWLYDLTLRDPKRKRLLKPD